MAERNVRSVELQLLRRGNAHNQLLSPLTDYLALCGDHASTTLHFPFEHQQLLVLLRALNYKDSEDTRRAQLDQVATTLSDVFSGVPGLLSELGRYRNSDEAYVHVSIATQRSRACVGAVRIGIFTCGVSWVGQSYLAPNRLAYLYNSAKS